MSYVVCRDYHFAENLIYFNRSDWAMYKNSDEIDIDIDVIHILVKCMYVRVGKMKSCPMSHVVYCYCKLGETQIVLIKC